MQIIAHLDMDAFFAAIEERENPQFRGMGIVVGADPKAGKGRGVVSTANYQARKYGIHSALPISIAWRLSEEARERGEPKTVFLPVNGAYYGEVSEKIFAIIRSYVPIVEQTSVDEAYMDLSFCLLATSLLRSPRSFSAPPKSENGRAQKTWLPANSDSKSSLMDAYQKAEDLIRQIKQQIWDSEKLTAKVALAPNKLVAKIASSLSKPDSLSIIFPQDISTFLDPLSVRVIPGVGPKSEEFLHSKKIKIIKDLKQISSAQLKEWMGKWGEAMYQKARGIDDSPLEIGRELKSISEQETFDKDSFNAAFLLGKIQTISERVIERMKKDGVKGYKTVSITVRFSDFTTRTRSKTLLEYKNDVKTLYREGFKLFMPFLDARENPKKKTIRLLGVGIENFQSEDDQKDSSKKEKNQQQNLFETT